MTNKEKFLALVSEHDSRTMERNRERIRNRAMLRESQQIALKVLMKLDDLGWSQKDLANEMCVSPQQITKIVSGKENLTIETQIKLQNILDIPVLASYYEKKAEKEQQILTIEKKLNEIEMQGSNFSDNYQESKIISIRSESYSKPNYYQQAI